MMKKNTMKRTHHSRSIYILYMYGNVCIWRQRRICNSMALTCALTLEISPSKKRFSKRDLEIVFLVFLAIIISNMYFNVDVISGGRVLCFTCNFHLIPCCPAFASCALRRAQKYHMSGQSTTLQGHENNLIALLMPISTLPWKREMSLGYDVFISPVSDTGDMKLNVWALKRLY